MRRCEISGVNDGTPEAYRYKTVEELIKEGFFEPPDLDDDSEDEDIQREIEEGNKKVQLILEQIKAGTFQGKISYR